MYKWNPFLMFDSSPNEVRHISAGSQSSKSRPAAVSMYSGQQLALEQLLGSSIQRGMKKGAPAYPGRMYVPRTTEEEAYFQRVPALAQDIAGMRARLGKPAYEVTPETTEAMYETGIRAPMMREWRETVEPMIREQYAGPGYWGTARAEAETESAEQLATTLAGKRAELAYSDEQARRQAAEAAAGREAGYGLAMTSGEEQLLGTAGQYARSIEQEQVMADLQRWLMGEQVGGVTPWQYNPFMQLAFQFMGLTPYALGEKSESSGWNFGISY